MAVRFTFYLLLFAYWLPTQTSAASIMVNEYYNGSSNTGGGSRMVRDEFIEFLITENTSAASLAALTFGDSNDTTSRLQGVFRFDQGTLDTALANAGLGEFLPGTVIVVKGVNLGAQSLAYDPLNGGWSLELVAGQGARDHSETFINGNISIGNNGDVVWVSTSNPPTGNTDTSGFIHAIGHDNAPGGIATTVAAAFGSENILVSTVATGQSLANMGGATESLAFTTTVTRGTTNGGSNSTWISGLRTAALSTINVPEPGRAALLLLGLLMVQNRRVRRGGHHV